VDPFLVQEGRDRRGHIALLDKYYEDYGKGTLDIVAFLHFDFGALASHPRAKMERGAKSTREQIAPIILPRRASSSLARGARPRDRDRHRRQQLPHRAHRAR
jgi:hypothetical protein